MSTINRRLRTPFDKIADLYDKARPGYPEQLVEDVLALSEIPPDGGILEIGCGTGQATLSFAKRGYSMLCLELGETLAAFAAKNCDQYPGVKVQNTSFEEWELQRKSFDLVISAQAFDWIPPEMGYPKAAESLKDSGSLALFRNDIPDTDTELSRALKEVRERTAPQLAEHGKGNPWNYMAKKAEDQIKASGLFGEVVSKQYMWSEQYSAKEYTNLIKTYLAFRTLDEETQHQLLSGVRTVIEQFGGREVQYVASLSIAKVRR